MPRSVGPWQQPASEEIDVAGVPVDPRSRARLRRGRRGTLVPGQGLSVQRPDRLPSQAPTPVSSPPPRGRVRGRSPEPRSRSHLRRGEPAAEVQWTIDGC